LGKDTTQQTQWTFACAQLLQTCRLCCGLVADLLWGSRQIVTGLLQGKWCNGSKALNELQQQHPSNIDALQLA